MAKKKRVPELRFRGFEKEWEEKGVNEILVERNTQSPKCKEYPLMAFVAYEGVAEKGDRFNREFLVNDELNKKYKQTKYGDFIYSSNNLETGSIGLNNYGDASISPVYSIFQPTNKTNSGFIGCFLTREEFIQKMTRWRQGVIYGQWRIHEYDFLQIKVTIPALEEQIQIGTFFQNLDTRIALQQRKHDKLIAIKKAMLEKMFPKEGAELPEIRFKGFTGKWERKKLGEVAELNPKADVPDVFEYVDLESVTGIELISHREEKKKTAPSRAQRFAREGDLFYQMVRPYQRNNYLFRESLGNYVFSTGYAQIRPSIDGYFLLSLVRTGLFVKDVIDRCTGTGYPAINSFDLADINIYHPTKKDEQKKIGTFFQRLDSLISLHARELDKLKNIKKACLEKMFV